MEKLLHERLREGLENLVGGTFLLDTDSGGCVIYGEPARQIADEIERYYIPRPRFEDGEPVQFGDKALRWDGKHGNDGENVVSITIEGGDYLRYGFNGDCCSHLPFKRPTPKVYDADGVEIKVGDIVWPIDGETRFEVLEIDGIDGLNVRAYDGLDATWLMSNKLTHERPVFDAEGVRCVDGETVYHFDKVQGILPTPCVIEKVTPDGTLWWKGGGCAPARLFTHREPDSLESIAKYAKEEAVKYAGFIEPLNKVADRLTALIERGA